MHDIARAEALNNFFGNLIEAKKVGVTGGITKLAEKVICEIIDELSIQMPRKPLSKFSTEELIKELKQRKEDETEW